MNTTKIIFNHYKLFNDDPIDGVSININEDNIKEWDLTIMGPPDTMYEGGFFRAKMTFPNNFPMHPPTLKFISKIYHPNIYPDGKVCISILHPPGEDKWGYEKAEERWRPVHTINSILLSVISLFSSPNDESPANIDAGKDWRENRELFRKKVNECIEKSLEFLD